MLTHLGRHKTWESAVANAIEQDVSHIVVSCMTPSQFSPRQKQEALEIHHAAGIHPSCAHAEKLEIELNTLRDILERNPKVLVGEIGLDGREGQTLKETQEQAFIEQLKIANAFKRPTIVHCVKRSARVLELLAAHAPKTKTNARGYIHGYTGSPEMAREYIKQGFYISFGCALLNPKSKRARASVKALPLERLLVESDAPSMPLPGQNQGEPKNVVSVLKEIAHLKGLPEKEVQQIIGHNAQQLLSKPL